MVTIAHTQHTHSLSAFVRPTDALHAGVEENGRSYGHSMDHGH